MRYVHSLIPLLAALWLPAAALAASAAPPGLEGAEKDYYDQIFLYAMEALSPGQHYDWKSYGANGSISVGERFAGNSGTTCRPFSESFTIGGKSGAFIGTGCKRMGKDGWCKLKPRSGMTSCALETPNLFEDKLRGGGEAVDRGETSSHNMWYRLKNLF